MNGILNPGLDGRGCFVGELYDGLLLEGAGVPGRRYDGVGLLVAGVGGGLL